MKISEGCPRYFWSVIHSIFEVLSTVFSELSNENIGGLSTVFSECVQ